MRRVRLANTDLVALVDDADYGVVSGRSWYVVKKNGQPAYAATNIGKVSNHTVLMHRLILGVKDSSVFVDHRDHNGFDNRRSNLRECGSRQNQFNRKSAVGSSSRFKGVGWDKARMKWRVKIAIDGIQKMLGRFEDEIEAALVYDRAARQHHGEFALTNFPQGA